MSDKYVPEVHELPHVIVLFSGGSGYRESIELIGPYRDMDEAMAAARENKMLNGRKWEVHPIFPVRS